MVTLEDLKNRQNRFDEEAENLYQKAKEVYKDLDDIIPIVLDPAKGLVYKKGSPIQTEALSVDLVNAIRLRSLKHTPNPGYTCVRCELKYDDYGYIVACQHYWMPDDDQKAVDEKGREIIIEGLKTKLRKGRIKAVLSEYVLFQ